MNSKWTGGKDILLHLILLFFIVLKEPIVLDVVKYLSFFNPLVCRFTVVSKADPPLVEVPTPSEFEYYLQKGEIWHIYPPYPLTFRVI